MSNAIFDVVTVTLNPAIDQTVTISNFTAGAVNRVEHTRANPGGKGVNVAAALADYGTNVAATGFLGQRNSATFEELFRRKDIADHFVRIAGETRYGIKITDPARGETTDVNFPGPAPTTADLRALRQQIDELSALEGAWFVLAGSVPPGVDPAIYADFTTSLRAAGQKVILDTSGEPLRLALPAGPSVIKPNIHELETLLGTPLPDRDAVVGAARKLLGGGIELVAVSMGGDGACFVTAAEAVTVRPPVITVRSTVGAGDAMVAGIVAAHLRDLPLADAARLATAFSVEALTRIHNGDASSRAAIEAILPEVTVA